MNIQARPTGEAVGQGSSARLNGTLESGTLADLVQFLHTLRRTGHLVIERDQPPESASVYVVDGRVVHAWCPPLSGAECFYALLNWRSGRFLFLGGGTPERRTIAGEPRALLLEGMRRQDELQRALVELPAPTAVLHRANDRAVLDREPLSVDEWRLYSQVDGRRSVRDLVETVGRWLPEHAHRLLRLVRLGVVRCESDTHFLAGIVVQRCTADTSSADADGTAATALLAHADGRHTLADIAERTGCREQALIDAVRDLVAAGIVEITAGEEEYRRYVE